MGKKRACFWRPVERWVIRSNQVHVNFDEYFYKTNFSPI